MPRSPRVTKIYDVTRIIASGMDVYPGDPEVRIASVADVKEGDPYTVSALAMGSHAGTHVDAPRHLFPDGAGVDGISPEHLIGPAAVIDAGKIISIGQEHLVASMPREGCERLLLKTRSEGRDGVHAFLNPEAAHWLVSKDLRLLGIDAPSVDAEGDDSLPVHRILLEAGVVIVEGLELHRVPAGAYTLVCLPLKLKDCDGAPARVMLLECEA